MSHLSYKPSIQIDTFKKVTNSYELYSSTKPQYGLAIWYQHSITYQMCQFVHYQLVEMITNCQIYHETSQGIGQEQLSVLLGSGHRGQLRGGGEQDLPHEQQQAHRRQEHKLCRVQQFLKRNPI